MNAIGRAIRWDEQKFRRCDAEQLRAHAEDFLNMAEALSHDGHMAATDDGDAAFGRLARACRTAASYAREYAHRLEG